MAKMLYKDVVAYLKAQWHLLSDAI
jgi:hypothetical protein